MLRQWLNPKVKLRKLPETPPNFIVVDGERVHLELPGKNLDVAAYHPDAAMELEEKFKMYLQISKPV